MINTNPGTVAIPKSRRKKNNNAKGKTSQNPKPRQNNIKFRDSILGKLIIAFLIMIGSKLSNLFERASTIFRLLIETKRYVSVLSMINLIFVILIHKLNYKLSYPLYVGIYLGLTALNIILPRVYKGKLARFSILDVIVVLFNLELTYLFVNTGVRSMFAFRYVYPPISFLVINILVTLLEKAKFERFIPKYKKAKKEEKLLGEEKNNK